MLASLKHFLANEQDRAGRLKRGGGLASLSLDWQEADSRYQIDSPRPAQSGTSSTTGLGR